MNKNHLAQSTSVLASRTTRQYVLPPAYSNGSHKLRYVVDVTFVQLEHHLNVMQDHVLRDCVIRGLVFLPHGTHVKRGSGFACVHVPPPLSSAPLAQIWPEKIQENSALSISIHICDV